MPFIHYEEEENIHTPRDAVRLGLALCVAEADQWDRLMTLFPNSKSQIVHFKDFCKAPLAMSLEVEDTRGSKSRSGG